jgi:hypothetical protein
MTAFGPSLNTKEEIMKTIKSICLMILLIPCIGLEILFQALEVCFSAGHDFMDKINDKLMKKALQEDEPKDEEENK